ncbi:hypothetical protein V6N13_025660 [Hibiscus sabdariffa]
MVSKNGDGPPVMKMVKRGGCWKLGVEGAETRLFNQVQELWRRLVVAGTRCSGQGPVGAGMVGRGEGSGHNRHACWFWALLGPAKKLEAEIFSRRKLETKIFSRRKLEMWNLLPEKAGG